AVGAGFVVAGLVRQDHAGLERRGAELGDAGRSFVHREIAADAVAGAVVEVESLRPQELPSKGVELGAGRTLGKDRARNCDMALEHAGEAVAHLGSRLADRDGAGNVGGAVLVLAAGVDQKQLARRNDAIALGRDAIMDDRAVGTGASDGWKRNVL